MSYRKSPVRSAIVIAFTIFIVMACGDINNEDLQCEEAVSRLQDCCDTIDVSRFSCERTQGCSPTTVIVSQKAALCIRDRSCGDMNGRGICANITRISRDVYPQNYVSQIEVEACK